MPTAEQIRTANVRYHNVAAAGYDAKWSIAFDPAGRRRMAGKLARALGQRRAPRFGRALEVGAGTGYFALNLLRAGVVAEVVATDISPGMLRALRASAARQRLDVETAVCEAAELPFDDGAFDLVLGHAVLHHLPDLPDAFEEFRRVLAPGGAIVFCGEPSRHGHRLATVPKRAARLAAPAWRAALGVDRRAHTEAASDEALEAVVDVHSFTPRELRRLAVGAGFEQVRLTGEELVASWFGWLSRTLEASAPPGGLPWGWYKFALNGYLTLEAVDRRVLEPHLPPAAFYNLLLSARAPTARRSASAEAETRPIAALA